MYDGAKNLLIASQLSCSNNDSNSKLSEDVEI